MSESVQLLTSGVSWRKSSRSGALGNCVELAFPSTDAMAVRNSRNPEGPALAFPLAGMRAFVAETKGGEFDLDR